ncbi:FAD dependent oxidoreductase superfamily protein [Colletotrichum scovillei]|uniref:FAD dependent oxidoreductase superfamily protein n=1 Tax=Colletotrichum scovillei TaxID=1209932 RepID=UPI0015C2D9BC|nr:FAD dependent oxidoreductase superfamily protein [Colletotrichum scovillei]KAF4776077.1 FAD dependent oxidoreductase superfamily protein [Colletotrichum scovillei]
MPVPKPTNRTPVPNPVPSFWNAAPRPLDDHRTTPDLPAACDIVIVGAGFAGVATAYHILKDNPSPPSIIILEARKVCSGASGRNGGHVKPDTYFQVPKYTKLFGPEQAAKLAAFEASNVYAVKELVESEGLDCDFHLTRAIDVYLDPEHAKETEAAYRELVKAGVVNMKDVAFTPKKDAERVSGVKGAQCAFSFTAAHLWPAKMVHQLLDRLLQKGLNLQANTPVTSISSQPDPARRHQRRQSRRSHKRLHGPSPPAIRRPHRPRPRPLQPHHDPWRPQQPAPSQHVRHPLRRAQQRLPHPAGGREHRRRRRASNVLAQAGRVVRQRPGRRAGEGRGAVL